MKGADLEVGQWYITGRPDRWSPAYRPPSLCCYDERIVKLVAKNVMPNGYHKVEIAINKDGDMRDGHVHSASFRRPCDSPFPIEGTEEYREWRLQQLAVIKKDILSTEQAEQAKEVMDLYSLLFENGEPNYVRVKDYNRPVVTFAGQMIINFGTDLATHLIEAVKSAILDYQPKEESNGYLTTTA